MRFLWKHLQALTLRLGHRASGGLFFGREEAESSHRSYTSSERITNTVSDGAERGRVSSEQLAESFGATPWDIGQPDFNLVQTVASTPINHCKALDIGCGTGDNVIWLAQQGFDVIGIDTSELAIKGSERESVEVSISSGFLESDEFGLGNRQSLCLE
jgi:2-polyprenyl-3-methyl-5-hydroxy-6-metoxy-1,4-benzoquinol methylase